MYINQILNGTMTAVLFRYILTVTLLLTCFIPLSVYAFQFDEKGFSIESPNKASYSKFQLTLEHAFGDSNFSDAGSFSAHLKTWSHGSQRCLLGEDSLDEHIAIHTEGVNILAVNHGASRACPYPRQLKLPAKWSFKSPTLLKNTEQAPRKPIFTE